METPVEYKAGNEPDEERIFISQTKSIDGFRDENATIRGYTRKEATERIAKAICRRDNCLDSCLQCVLGFGQTKEMKEKFCKQVLKKEKKLDASYMQRAQAALDELLKP